MEVTSWRQEQRSGRRGCRWWRRRGGGVRSHRSVRAYRRGPTGGTGVIADRDSDTRQQLGGRRGYSRRGGGDGQQAAGRGLSLLAELREPADVHEAPRLGVAARSRHLSLGRPGARRASNVEWDARIINEIDDRLIAWQSLEGSTSRPPGRSTSTRPPAAREVRVQSAVQPAGRQARRRGRVAVRRGAERPDSRGPAPVQAVDGDRRDPDDRRDSRSEGRR